MEETIHIPHKRIDISLVGERPCSDRYFYTIVVNCEDAGAVSFSAEEPIMDEIEVHEKFRKKGVAEAVYLFIEREYFAKNTDRMEIEAFNSARGFWEKMGYELDRVEEYDEKGDPYLLIMFKYL